MEQGMDVGIGLPATIPGAEREEVLGWARRAEERGFSSLGVIDRIVYPNYEPLIALAAAASVTDRIALTTAILIAPLRSNTAHLAKQAATVDRLSRGRLTLGLAVGARDDDYRVSGVRMEGRGRAIERQIGDLRRIWAGEVSGYSGTMGPPPGREGGPPIVLGGSADPVYRRAARLADGWIGTGMGPDQYREAAANLRELWRGEGRDGEPALKMLLYFSLGDRGEESADWYIDSYYGFLGDVADQIRASVATDPETVRQYVDGFAGAGCDEAILFPCSTDVEQVDLLAEAAGLG
jgi:alkanesulfonate monooxygenase SsuD/methylene tetrahydromethanopterin reductase-like flavin-dependent oxidoreductase (luciferase family)